MLLSCNAAFIQCVNYFVCPVDPDKLITSNVYNVFFICDVYLSKSVLNEYILSSSLLITQAIISNKQRLVKWGY